MANEPYTLPHGAIGIDSEQFAIEFREDKVVFILKDESGRHFTLSAGRDSGVIDLHETSERGNIHQTRFAIERDALPVVLYEFIPMLNEFSRLLRPLRLGWLGHHGITMARGVDPVSDEDIGAVTRKNRRKRLVIEPDLLEGNLFVPEYLDQVWDFLDGNFTLLKDGVRIGSGFKKTEADGHVSLSWIKLRDLERLQRRWAERMQTAFLSAAIPPERGGEFSFLRA